MCHFELLIHVYLAVLTFLSLPNSAPSLSALCFSFFPVLSSLPSWFLIPAPTLHSLHSPSSCLSLFLSPLCSCLFFPLSLPLVLLPSSTDGELHQRGEELCLRSVCHRHSSIFNQECICLKGALNTCANE